jgi:hypothetical protein
LRAQDVVIATGHTLALAITLSDLEWTTPNRTDAEVTIDLGHSDLRLPAVGGLRLTPADSGLDQGQAHGPAVHGNFTETTRVP